MTRGFVAVIIAMLASSAMAQQFQPVDITPFIDRPLSSYKPNESWAAPPRGLQTLEGVPFNIVGKIELTGLGAARDGRFYPTRITAIPVGRKAARLHVLQACGYADREGTPVAQVAMNYADGERYAVPLSYGVHTRNWYVERVEATSRVTDSNTVIAWKGSCPDTDRIGVSLRLFRTAFPNPFPQKEIKTIDLVSLFSRATPVIVSVTTETGDGRSFTPEKFDHAPYRRELAVRVDPPTPTVIHVNATDASRTYKFGTYTNSVNSRAIIDYSPQMKQLQLTVNSSDFLPVVTNIAKDFPSELLVKLHRGSAIGGFVRTAKGQPIEGAEVILSHVAEDAPGEFVERDLAWTKTDQAGRWTLSSIIGTNFERFNFAVRHPEFISGNFQQFTDTNGMLTTEALLAQKAQLVISKGASITGTVVDADTGAPVSTFKVIPGKSSGARDNPLQWERHSSLAAWDGKFTFQLTEQDASREFGLLIEAQSYQPAASPRYTNFGNYTHHFRLKKEK